MKKVKTSLVTVRKEDVEIKPVESVKYLFTTKTCPNCRIAKEILKGEDYQIIDAEENQELVEKIRHHAGTDAGRSRRHNSKEIRQCVEHQEIEQMLQRTVRS